MIQSDKGYPFHFGADMLDLGSRIMAVDSIRDTVSREAGKRYFESLERSKEAVAEQR